MKRGPKTPRSLCPIVNTLDILGDRWSLVIVRDLMFRGMHEYGELLNAGEGISTSVLASRLEQLQCAGLIEKTAHPADLKKYRYHLTEKGIDLMPVMIDLVLWGLRHVPGTAAPPEAIKAIRQDREGFMREIAVRLREERRG